MLSTSTPGGGGIGVSPGARRSPIRYLIPHRPCRNLHNRETGIEDRYLD